MLNWIDYRKKLTGRIGEFAAASPDTFKGYQTLSRAAEKTGQLDAKTRELIALAVSVTTRSSRTASQPFRRTEASIRCSDLSRPTRRRCWCCS